MSGAKSVCVVTPSRSSRLPTAGSGMSLRPIHPNAIRGILNEQVSVGGVGHHHAKVHWILLLGLFLGQLMSLDNLREGRQMRFGVLSKTNLRAAQTSARWVTSEEDRFRQSHRRGSAQIIPSVLPAKTLIARHIAINVMTPTAPPEMW